MTRPGEAVWHQVVDLLAGAPSVALACHVAPDGDALGAAWGDPAIVLRCGVGTPAGYNRFAACQRVNGLDWFVPDEASKDQSLDVVMTTIGRRPAVEVRLPATYRPPVAPMVDIGGVIEEHTEVTEPCG